MIAVGIGGSDSAINEFKKGSPTGFYGSVIISPKTGTVAEAVTTVSSEKNRKFSGRPSQLPLRTERNVRAYREKSPKLSIGPEK